MFLSRDIQKKRVVSYSTTNAKDREKYLRVTRRFRCTNLIICSANSDLLSHSAVDPMSGSDYDGDNLTVIWDERLIKPFRNSTLAVEIPEESKIPKLPTNIVRDNQMRR